MGSLGDVSLCTWFRPTSRAAHGRTTVRHPSRLTPPATSHFWERVRAHVRQRSRAKVGRTNMRRSGVRFAVVIVMSTGALACAADDRYDSRAIRNDFSLAFSPIYTAYEPDHEYK